MAPTDSRLRAPWKRALVASLGLATLGWSDDLASDRGVRLHGLDFGHPARAEPRRALVRGDAFPDGVFALTWDDGPDRQTIALARYLHDRRVSATFFVVAEWIDDVSADPGVGDGVYRTGYRHLPVLGDLVALGHRVGNHTANHVHLGDAPSETVIEQLARAQQAIDPFLTDELRLFRAPGGSWSRTADIASSDPRLAAMTGPVHWDIDAKDWDASLYRRGSAPSESEPSPVDGQTRVRASVVAQRYLDQANATRRGIILLHDRVGHVGSRYALDLAERLVPELQARGAVFSAPLLAFSPSSERLAMPSRIDARRAILADIDGDRRADLCAPSEGSLVCVRALTRPDATGLARTAFEAPFLRTKLPEQARALAMGDVDGDGRADLCVVVDDAIECTLTTSGTATTFHRALAPLGGIRNFWLADVDGDGRADVCARTGDAIVCAMSKRGAFDAPAVWLARAPDDADGIALADVDGDGRADLCARASDGGGVVCASSNGHGFQPLRRWSDDVASGPLLFADLNGDGRADACTATREGVACALSDGKGFKHSSIWAAAQEGTLRLGDVNGDGRGDLCVIDEEHVACGLAP